ncbi:MAG: glycosyltransferase, partial [Deltaproteobacteria bacterium]|nr:glycosyltransferase [Deltaproteobacteria bacterium]
PHLVHVHRIKEHFLAVLAIMFSFHKIPLVRTVHGLSGVCKNLAFKQHLRSSIAVFLDKQLIKYKSDVVIAVSKDLEDHLRTGKVKGDIYQIYNSINTHDYQLTHNRDVIRHKYHVENHFWIGTAVRLVEPKNLGMLIESGRQLLTGEIPFKISIFGDGPLKKELQEHIDAYGLSEKVELHGFERDILPLINAMDVFVLCSEHEGLPMALLEAMFLMTPVVCTAVGGMKEVIEDGINGILVPPNDVSTLTESLRQMYRNKESASKLATNARATIEKKFSLSVTIKQVSELYAHYIN